MAKVWDSSISVSFWSLSRYSHIIYFVPCAPPGAVYLDCASLHYFVILDSSFLVLQEIRSCCASVPAEAGGQQSSGSWKQDGRSGMTGPQPRIVSDRPALEYA